MKKGNRIIFSVTVLLLLMVFTSSVFAMTEYPTKRIEIIVPFSVGGGTDVFARQVAQAISKVLGVQLLTINVPGAGSLLGLSQAALAEPDGYTLAAFNPPSSPVAQMVQKPQDLDLREFVAIGGYTIDGYLLFVHPDSPYDTFPELVDAFEKGEITLFGTQHQGTMPYMVPEALKEQGVKIPQYVHYDGTADVAAAVIRKEVPAGISTGGTAVDFVESEQIKPIVMTMSTRHPALPDLPSITEYGYESIDYVARITRILTGPPGMSDEIRDILEAALEEALTDEELLAWSETTGLPIFFISAEESQKSIEESFLIGEYFDLEEM